MYYEQKLHGQDDAAGTFDAQQMDWTVGMRCILHVASSAIKWGLSPHSSEAVLDDAHKCIKGLRSSSESLLALVRSHVVSHTRYLDSQHSLGDREEFWRFMGLREEAIPWVMEVDPRWDAQNNVLMVRSALDAQPGSIDKIEAVVAFFLRWRSWSDTRWAGVGPSARMFLASLCVGVQAMVHRVAASGKDNEKLYIGSARKRTTPDVIKYMIFAATASYPAEVFTLKLMKDDRFCRFALALKEQLRTSIARVTHLPDATWMVLASLLPGPAVAAHTLRHQALSCMWTSAAYLDRHAYSVIKSGILSLTQATSIATRMQELSREDPSTLDKTMQKVH